MNMRLKYPKTHRCGGGFRGMVKTVLRESGRVTYCTFCGHTYCVRH